MADATETSACPVQFQVDGVDTGFAGHGRALRAGVGHADGCQRARTRCGRGRMTRPGTRGCRRRSTSTSRTSSFQNEVLVSGFDLPTAIEFLPDGRHAGRRSCRARSRCCRRHTRARARGRSCRSPTSASPVCSRGSTTWCSIPTSTSTTTTTSSTRSGRRTDDRVSRFTANALLNGTVPGSELVLYQDAQDAHAEHHGGALNFGNDGKLYFTTGEHFNPPMSQELTSPRGKIHRINPDGTVPTDNPFYDGTGPELRLDLGARAAQSVPGLLRPADRSADHRRRRRQRRLDGDRGDQHRRPGRQLRLAQRRRPVRRAVHEPDHS